LIKTINLLQN